MDKMKEAALKDRPGWAAETHRGAAGYSYSGAPLFRVHPETY